MLRRSVFLAWMVDSLLQAFSFQDPVLLQESLERLLSEDFFDDVALHDVALTKHEQRESVLKRLLCILLERLLTRIAKLCRLALLDRLSPELAHDSVTRVIVVATVSLKVRFLALPALDELLLWAPVQELLLAEEAELAAEAADNSLLQMLPWPLDSEYVFALEMPSGDRRDFPTTKGDRVDIPDPSDP